ncbi:MAG: glycerate kinase [Bacteroidetes bacterium]|nr:MAG: glycerate kinase [Bacteroidota bacterium]
MSAVHAKEIYDAALNSVQPESLIPQFLKLDGNSITIGDNSYELDSSQKIILIGAGKASAAMAQAAEKILGDKIAFGIIVTKYGHSLPLKYCKIIEAGHPVPDQNSVFGCSQIVGAIEGKNESDLIIFLLSGGASSLLTDLPTGISLDDIINLNKNLLNCGADIHETNTVRKHVSQIKGGQLTKIALPAKIHTLILSDVPGDDPSSIASGPTIPDQTTFKDAFDVVVKYKLENKIPTSVIDWLHKGITEENNSNNSERKDNYGPLYSIIGSNSSAIDAARKKATELKYHVEIIPSILHGEAREKAIEFLQIINKYTAPRPVCFLWGGESSVTVKGDGKGGRCQEFVLSAINEIIKSAGDFSNTPIILCAGTDGTDGDTDAAGAIMDKSVLESIKSMKLDPFPYLDQNNSYNFFRKTGGLIVTGPTSTNVMDIVIGIK